MADEAAGEVLTAETLAELERLSGDVRLPWVVQPDGHTVREAYDEDAEHKGRRVCIWAGDYANFDDRVIADFDYLVAAANALPALIAAARERDELRAEVAELEAAIDRAMESGEEQGVHVHRGTDEFRSWWLILESALDAQDEVKGQSE